MINVNQQPHGSHTEACLGAEWHVFCKSKHRFLSETEFWFVSHSAFISFFFFSFFSSKNKTTLKAHVSSFRGCGEICRKAQAASTKATQGHMYILFRAPLNSPAMPALSGGCIVGLRSRRSRFESSLCQGGLPG